MRERKWQRLEDRWLHQKTRKECIKEREGSPTKSRDLKYRASKIGEWDKFIDGLPTWEYMAIVHVKSTQAFFQSFRADTYVKM